MNCPLCLAIASAGDRFCEQCGTPLANFQSAHQGSEHAIELALDSIVAPTVVTAAVQAASSSVMAHHSGATKLCHCPAENMDDSVTSGIDGFCNTCGYRIADATMVKASRNMDLGADLGLACDIGRRHKVNQDAGSVALSQNGASILVVADGVSSSDHADLASASAVDAATRVLLAAASEADADAELIQRAVMAAHEAVIGLPYLHKQLAEPETTIVAAIVRGSRVCVAWVGDSRAYRLTATEAHLLTRDDSWLADALDEGVMDAAAAYADRRAHSITQCLGMRDADPYVHVREYDLENGDLLLLCTDGLWNYYEEPADLHEAAMSAQDAGKVFTICQHLVDQANAAGGHDNITVGIQRIMPSPGT